jgi:hypothetical protein
MSEAAGSEFANATGYQSASHAIEVIAAAQQYGADPGGNPSAHFDVSRVCTTI